MLRFRQNIVGVVGGDGEDWDAILRQKRGDFGEDPHQREVQNVLNTEGLPTVVPSDYIGGHIGGGADQREFLVRFAGEAEFCRPIHLRVVRYLTHGEILLECFDLHAVDLLAFRK